MATQQIASDWRLLANGSRIPTVSYCDQPFLVKTDDGAWLCCVTTGAGHEGAPGQHVTTLRSLDQGKSWSAPVPVEKPGGSENSYAVMLKAPSGRIYIFYNHNTDNVREVKCHDGVRVFDRVDSLGHFVFKYSDDHGRTWSARRYDIPVREFACDRENVYGGALRFFWNVGKPFFRDGAAFVSLHKVGQMGEGFFQQSEGALLRSDNLLSETDAAKIRWETMPDGDVGLRTPPGGSPIAEEQSYCVLSDGSIYCVYRSIDGYPVESYSRDGGHTWSEPRYKRDADGRLMKNPRAANFVWKCENGKYLYWFHNHGGHFIREMWGAASETNGLLRHGGASPYDDRNPAWICGGVEADAPDGRIIRWSQPEILLYDDDPFIRISYPDLIEEGGRYFVTETQKSIARMHEIPAAFLEKIWASITGGVARDEVGPPLFTVDGVGDWDVPALPEFNVRDCSRFDFGGRRTGGGFTLCLKIQGTSRGLLLDGLDAQGRGLALEAAADGSLTLTLADGWSCSRVTSEPGLVDEARHALAIVVDGGAGVVSFVVDGRFADGGEHRQFGWGRFNPTLRHVNWAAKWRVVEPVLSMTSYNRALMTAEAVALTGEV